MLKFNVAVGGDVCPGCQKKVKAHEEVVYQPRSLPMELLSPASKTVLWHSDCADLAVLL